MWSFADEARRAADYSWNFFKESLRRASKESLRRASKESLRRASKETSTQIKQTEEERKREYW